MLLNLNLNFHSTENLDTRINQKIFAMKKMDKKLAAKIDDQQQATAMLFWHAAQFYMHLHEMDCDDFGVTRNAGILAREENDVGNGGWRLCRKMDGDCGRKRAREPVSQNQENQSAKSHECRT